MDGEESLGTGHSMGKRFSKFSNHGARIPEPA